MFDESPAEAWRLRYGVEAPAGLPDLDRFLNHRSVRQFSDRPIDEVTMEALIAAAQSAATSSNLQLYSIISMDDPELRASVNELSGDQKQIASAASFLGFFADHYRLKKWAAEVGSSSAGMDYTEFFVMSVIDAALAAERLVCAAESLGLGICYIGGLRNHPAKIQELLDLPEGVAGIFGLCLGYPSKPLTATIRPRLPQSSIFFRNRYDRGVDKEGCDVAAAEFHSSQNMSGSSSWLERSAKRVESTSLGGREIWKEWLERQGFNLK